MNPTVAFIFTIALCLTTAFAAENPCHDIRDACEKAGFVKGHAGDGTGLWKDCLIPLIQGQPQPATAKLKLPKIDPDLLAKCKEKHAMPESKVHPK